MKLRVGLTPSGERKEKTATHKNHIYITISLEDVGMHYSLAVMSHSFPVVWRVNTAVNSKDD